MDPYDTAETWTGVPGTIAPADGNADRNSNYETRNSSAASGPNFDSRVSSDGGNASQPTGDVSSPHLGPNNERLEDAKPELVHALRELVRQYRQEGVVARRHEIRRIRQARLFWQGLQYRPQASVASVAPQFHLEYLSAHQGTKRIDVRLAPKATLRNYIGKIRGGV